MRGRPKTNGICRHCGHKQHHHGYVGPVHTCYGCRIDGKPECQRYLRDRRKAVAA